MQLKGNVRHPFTCKILLYIFSGLRNIRLNILIVAMVGVGVGSRGKQREMLISELASIRFLVGMGHSRGI